MKEQKFENYFGRKIAVDASMHIYSFLVRFTMRKSCFETVIICQFNSSIPLQLEKCLLNFMVVLCQNEQSPLLTVIQVVVGRTGDQLLTSETGDVTR